MNTIKGEIDLSVSYNFDATIRDFYTGKPKVVIIKQIKCNVLVWHDHVIWHKTPLHWSFMQLGMNDILVADIIPSKIVNLYNKYEKNTNICPIKVENSWFGEPENCDVFEDYQYIIKNKSK